MRDPGGAGGPRRVALQRKLSVGDDSLHGDGQVRLAPLGAPALAGHQDRAAVVGPRRLCRVRFSSLLLSSLELSDTNVYEP